MLGVGKGRTSDGDTMTPEEEVKANLLGRILYEELRKKGYSNEQLKMAGALLHDLARDDARKQNGDERP